MPDRKMNRLADVVSYTLAVLLSILAVLLLVAAIVAVWRYIT